MTARPTFGARPLLAREYRFDWTIFTVGRMLASRIFREP